MERHQREKFKHDNVPRIITMKKMLYSLLFVLFSPAVFAGGNTLLEECGEIIHFAETGRLDERSAGASFCMGMVNGMMVMNTIYRSQQPTKGLFCPPEGTVTNAEGARVVVNYLNANPQQLDTDAGSLMFFAFRDAYPCPNP